MSECGLSGKILQESTHSSLLSQVVALLREALSAWSQQSGVGDTRKVRQLTPCRVGAADHLPQIQGGAAKAGKPEGEQELRGSGEDPPRLPALQPLPDQGGGSPPYSKEPLRVQPGAGGAVHWIRGSSCPWVAQWGARKGCC